MSAGRVAGQSGKCGKKPRPLPGMRDRATVKRMKHGLHDCLHRSKVVLRRPRNPRFGKQSGQRKRIGRWRPRAWVNDFVLDVESTGSRRTSAENVGVPYGTVRVSICRDRALRLRVAEAEDAYLLRLWGQLCRRQIDRLEISPAKAIRLTALLSAKATEGSNS